jgi:hypothetical protein
MLLLLGQATARETVEDCVPGVYLTDGRDLFRVVSRLGSDGGRMLASLEDCVTLEVSHYTPDELYRMQLRRVPPGA